MAQLLVTCPECGVRGELAHSGQEFNNSAGKCKHVLPPARCPSLRIPLLGARRVLEHLEWDAFLAADGEIRIPAEFVQTPTVPDPDEVVPDPFHDLGLAVIAADVPPQLARTTIASVHVLGALQASPAVKAALSDRIR